jgi:cupin 2 domain-containing protein
MTANLFTAIPEHLPEELTTILQAGEGVRIERIVSQGHSSPQGFWYDQPDHEWVLVLKGAARIEFENSTFEMKPGDYLNIPARTKHRVAWTTPKEPTIWLAVHYGKSPAPPT